MRKIFYIIVAILVLSGVFKILNKKDLRDKEIKIEVENEIPVEVEKVKEIIIKEEIESIGEIEPFQKVTVYSEVSGKIEKLNVKEGDYVKKGDFIAQIDYKKRKLEYDNILNQIKSVEANLENVKKDYERFSKLYNEGVISEKKLDDIKTNYEVISRQLESLKTQFELVKIRLNETFIYSPITGFIAEKYIDEGEIITESTMMRTVPIVAIVDISKVKIKFFISSEKIGKVKIGDDVLISVSSYPEKIFKGKVTKTYPLLNEKTRTLPVECTVENPQFLLKPGMYCKGKIITGVKKSLAIPLDAIMKLPVSGNYYCFRVKDNTAEKVYIKIGEVEENYIEVKEGLNKDDIVIVTSQGILDTGKKIKIIKEKI